MERSQQSNWHPIPMMCKYLVFLLLIGLLSEVKFAVTKPNCGYQSCPVGKPDMINVHLICHTHDDVGWVRTVDEYYEGGQWVTVKNIINSVVNELPKGSDRKFIYVETSFFWKWWQQQTEEKQNKVKELVESGQLEFIGGGWSMNDEATVYYQDVIDQMTLGLRKLRELFGLCGIPKVAWQIDPFGHSREQASLFAQMGYDGLFIGRIHYNDKFDRLNHKTMEFIWNASASLGAESQLFTGALYDEYSAPKTFCFDAVCGNEPIRDGNSYNNVNERVSSFLNIVRNQSEFYATNHVMVTMGGDFTYVRAENWFENLDKLIYYTNKMQKHGSKFNLMYSTPSCYLKALHENKKDWTVKTDDFFPYASEVHAYWTGYFTSRPYLKRLVRKATNILQTCKQLHFLTQEFSDNISDPNDLLLLKEAMAIAQHHDAVSGTAKQYVTNDYMYRLNRGIQKCHDIINNAYQNIIPTPNTKLSHCWNLDVSKCDISEKNKRFTVTLYNPLARPVEHMVRLPVHTRHCKVYGPNGDKIPAQLIPVSKHKLSLPTPVHVHAHNELVFKAELPAVGFKTYFVTNSFDKLSDPISFKQTESEDVILSNNKIKVVINGKTGLLQQVTDIANDITVPVRQNFYYYNSYHDYEQASGAYIFRPNGTKVIVSNSTKLLKIVKGPIVDEIHQIFNEWITQIIRLPKDADYVEMEWTIGPISINDSIWDSTYFGSLASGGKEVVSVFETDLETHGQFYTDANGREILKRRLNKPSKLSIETHEPFAGNYYPVNTRIFIQDKQRDIQLTLLTDRSVGGTSLENGSLEIMLHRRLLYDDHKGVDENLSEMGSDGRGLVVRGKTLLLIDPIPKAARHHRQLAQEILFSPFVSFTNDSNSSWKNLSYNHQAEFSGIAQRLPSNVHLLTLEVLKRPYVLLRLEHFYEKHEDSELSHPVTVDLKGIFKRSRVISVRETTLGANQGLDELERFQWQQEGQDSSQETLVDGGNSSITSDFVIQLKPMQIRTFIVELDGKWASSVELGLD